MLHALFELIPKSSILLIDVHIVSLKIIIRDIDVWVTVIIYIPNCYAEPKADQASVNACLLGYVCEMSIVISQQMIPTAFPYCSYGPIRIGKISLIGVIQTVRRNGTVIDDKTIEVAIQIVVKKTYLRCVA